MGDLAVDTATEQIGPNTFLCDLSPDWEIWGPNGGYLASVALRAAGIASGQRSTRFDQRPFRRSRSQCTGGDLGRDQP